MKKSTVKKGVVESGASTPEDKIKLITKLGKLKDSGAITQEELEEKKLRILS